MVTSDFWSLSSEELVHYTYVDLFYQEPYSDEPKTEKDPFSCPLLKSSKRYSLDSVNEWKERFRHVNIFRSYSIYNSDINGEEIFGPLILDIDRTIEKDGGYFPDFEKALEDTRLLVKEYCSKIERTNYKLFFTGHKGFHIEIHPKIIEVLPHTDRRQNFENIRKNINERLGDTFVDVFHEHIRIHNSKNIWIDYFGNKVDSMNFEVSIDELFNFDAEYFFLKAKNLAKAF